VCQPKTLASGDLQVDCVVRSESEVQRRGARTWRNVTTDAQTKGENFVRFLKSDDIYVLFHSDLIFNVLPKRSFAPGEVGRFRKISAAK
jgi:hypothetical protein